jgi:hypothetical protein
MHPDRRAGLAGYAHRATPILKALGLYHTGDAPPLAVTLVPTLRPGLRRSRPEWIRSHRRVPWLK